MDRSYEIRVLTIEETEAVYMGPAVRHFPANERKPMKAIKRMYEQGNYQTLGLFDGEELVAYGLFVVLPQEALLLDYYGVLEEYRGRGVGTLFLRKMQEWYRDFPGIWLETEDVLLAENEEQIRERSRRNAFYLRNGVQETRIRAGYFGADYQIFYLPIGEIKSEQDILAGVVKLYRVMLQEKMENVRLKICGGAEDEENIISG